MSAATASLPFDPAEDDPGFGSAVPARADRRGLALVPPLTSTPRRRRPVAAPAAARRASVTVLHPPSDDAPGTRLTRRGAALLGVLVVAACAGLLWLAVDSGPGAGAASVPSGRVAATVTVGPGDTLWSIASRVAPQRDPRAEVATLASLNDLSGDTLSVGQRLRTR